MFRSLSRRSGRLLTAAMISLVPATAFADPISLSGTSGSYSQNFDFLIQTSLINWTNDATTAVEQTDGSGINGWFAANSGTTTPLTINGNAGSNTTGGLNSYGAVATPERALGTLPTNGFGSLSFGAYFQNNTGRTINSISVGYTGEQWRNNGVTAQQVLAFSYRPSSGSFASTTSLPASGFTTFSALNFTSLIGTTTAASLNGNAAANRTVLPSTVLSGVSLVPGQQLYVRWDDLNDSGNDHGLAVDDFSLSFTTAPDMSVPASVNLGNYLRNAPITTTNVPVTNAGGSTGNYTATPASGVTTSVSNGSVAATSSSNIGVAPSSTADDGVYSANVAFSTPGDDSTGNDTITANYRVGLAESDGSNSMNTFGPALTATIAPSGVYTALSSTAASTINGGSTPQQRLGSSATILNGTNTSGVEQTVTMAWRNRVVAETGSRGNLPSYYNGQPLISDVVRITGMELTPLEVNAGGRKRTSPYVLQVSYDETLYANASTELFYALEQKVRLFSLDSSADGNNTIASTSDRWLPADEANFGGSSNFVGLGGYDLTTHGLNVGTWGVDIDKNLVWAVIDYNGDFAVIPEPSTYATGAMALIGLVGCGLRRRRMKATEESVVSSK